MKDNFFEKHKIKVFLSVMIFLLFVLLELTEFTIKMTSNNLSYVNKARSLNQSFDTRPPNIYAIESTFSEGSYQQVNPPTFINNNLIHENKKIFPMSGIANKEVILCNENGYWSKYISDKFGFNNKNSVWDLDKVENVFLGDSFTEGSCVLQGDSFVDIVKSSYKDTINLGHGGTGLLLQYATFKEFMPKKNIKNVFIMYYEGNDLENLMIEYKNEVLRKYVELDSFSQEMKDHYLSGTLNDKLISISAERQEFKPYLKGKIIEYTKSMYPEIFNTIRNIYLKPKAQLYDLEIDIKNFEIVLKRFRNDSIKRNIRLVFVYLPAYYRYDNIELCKVCAMKSKVTEIVQKLDVEFIDMDAIFTKISSNPKEFFPFNSFGHYNEKGHKLVGENINDFIRNNNEN